MKKNNRNVMNFLLSSTLSDLANWIYRLRVLSFVMSEYDSSFATSIVTFCMLLPPIILGTVAGALADKYNKKMIMVVSDLCRIVLLVLVIFINKSIILIPVLMAIFAVFSDVCEDSILVEIADSKELPKINNIYAILSSTIMIVGPSLGGIVAAVCSLKITIIIIEVMLIFSLLMRVLIKNKRNRLNSNLEYNRIEKKSYKWILGSDLRYYVYTSSIIGFAAGSLNSLLIVFVYDVLGKNSADYGYLLSIKGIAMLFASVILLKYIDKNIRQIYVLSIIGMGVVLFVFPFNNIWALAVILQSLLGIFNVIYSVSKKTIIQQSCDKAQIGRFFGFLTTVTSISSICALLALGRIADIIGVRYVLGMGGGLIIIAGIYAGTGLNQVSKSISVNKN